MTKIIQVVVNPQGETKIETSGFEGSSCQDATRELERALGATTEETLTGEYYAETNTQTDELQN
jgi:hypothetical protein